MPKKSTVRTQPNNIAAICKARKKTQREIAQQINFTEGYIATVKRGKVSCVSMEFAEKLAAALETQPEKIFPDYGSSRQQARENVRECRGRQTAGMKEAERRKQSIKGKNGGQQPEDKFNVKTQPNHIADWCAIRGITQRELAELAGMGQTQIADIKRGRRPHIRAAVVKRLSEALGAEPEELFDDYAAAKAAYMSDIDQNREFIFKSISERNAYIESITPLAKAMARKSAAMLLKGCRNSCMDMDDITAEAFLIATEIANNAMKRGIPKGAEISQYTCGGIEKGLKTLYKAQHTQQRAACLTISYDEPLSSDEPETTYLDFIRRGRSVEEIVILREECREAVRQLTPERRREPEIAALLQQIAI